MRSGQPDAQSSHWTIAASRKRFYIAAVLLTIFHWIFSAYLPPAEDEIYYWTWAKDLQASYYDHPPMVAYLIAFSTKIFGNGLFGIRFFAPLFALIVLLILRALCGRAQLLYYVCLTPVFMGGAFLMTPDVPLMLFWSLYLFWFVKVGKLLSTWSDDPITRVYHPSPISGALWGLGGVILGLGFLSKYSMFLAVPCSFMALFFRYRASGWWRGYLIHLCVAFLVASPLIYYNIAHDFVSFRFQWGNAMQGHGIHISRFFEYLGGQILMVGALPLIMLPWILLWRPEIRDDSKLDARFYFFVPTIFFFMLQSFRHKLEANWGLVTYLGFWPMAQSLMDRSSFKMFGYLLRVGSFLVPIVFSAMAAIHLISPLRFFPPKNDRVGKFREVFALSQEIAKDLAATTDPMPLFLPNYQLTSYFRYQGVNAFQTNPAGRQSQFTMRPEDACKYPAVYFLNTDEDPGASGPALQCFRNHTRVKVYDLTIRGEIIQHYYLDKYFGVP